MIEIVGQKLIGGVFVAPVTFSLFSQKSKTAKKPILKKKLGNWKESELMKYMVSLNDLLSQSGKILMTKLVVRSIQR